MITICKTAIKDVEELYFLLDSGERHEIGYFLLHDSPPLGSIITYLQPFKTAYSLFTILSSHYQDFLEAIPHERIGVALKEHHPDKYTVKNDSKEQIVIEADGKAYILSKKKMYLENMGMYDRLILETKQKRPTFQAFQQTLEEHNEILGSIVNSLYGFSAEAPCFTYFLEKTLAREKKESRGENGGRSQRDEKVSPDNLERLIEVDDPMVTFDQIGGCKRGKEEMLMICEDIEHPEIAKFFGRDPEAKKGILLSGDFGCGKTLLVKALATKLKKDLSGKVKFYVLHYKDITSIYRGGEAIATGQIFDLVEKNEKEGYKTILFIDELHVIAERRKDGLGPKDEALDTLLSHLDGMKKYKGLTVIGSTYQPLASLDKALIRPGRFGTWIKIEKPNKKERAEIFKLYIEQRQAWAAAHGNPNLFKKINSERLSEAAEGFNGSDIAQLVEKSVRNREREARKKGKGNRELILKEFKPITTRFFLQMIEDYRKKRGTDKKQGKNINTKESQNNYFPFALTRREKEETKTSPPSL